ncbi:MAG TPA: PPK2 family polyphosphate kinase [Caulobacterales bacterium]|nr:PPK2 family polyphosphate kinase [Caulobacterales bacterium]
MTTDWREIDKHVLVKPGEKVELRDRDAKCDDLFPDRPEAEAFAQAHSREIDALQDRLWAERARSLLVILQGIDTAGKDGTVRGVFNQCGPLGVVVTPFGVPNEEERAHDYLWRIHNAVPKKGVIGVWNRSHYEDVLVVKVRKLAPEKVIEQRYDQINAFEKHLTENNVVVLKFMLHISKKEQRERLQERLDQPQKNWKFNAGDLDDRKLWRDYEAAYETALQKCSTEHAPWRVIPADKKWRRNAIVSAIVRGTLEDMNPQYPKPSWKPSDFKIE